AGAVGVLRLAGPEARLADERRLLIAQDARDRHALDRFGAGDPVAFAAGANRRQHGAWNVERSEQLGVPVERVEVHQLGAARVGDVGHVQTAVHAARELPHEERVDGPEQRIAAPGALACAGDVVEQPADLQAGEIAGKRKAGAGAKELDTGRGAEPRHVPGDAHVLPDDGVAQRDPGAAIPQHRRLALVGDADGGERLRPQAAGEKGAGEDGLRVAPDLDRVVFDPAGPRADLLVLDLRVRDDARGFVEDDEAGAAGAL